MSTLTTHDDLLLSLFAFLVVAAFGAVMLGLMIVTLWRERTHDLPVTALRDAGDTSRLSGSARDRVDAPVGDDFEGAPS